MLEALVAKKIGGARSVIAPIEKTRSEKIVTGASRKSDW
jgi:hypothetical protein